MFEKNQLNSVQIYLAGVGGQGIISTGRLLLEVGQAEGYKIMGSEIHGMSQRGGAVEFQVRIGDFNALSIPKGEADIILAMEPIEMIRSLNYLKPDGIIIVNKKQIPPNVVNIANEKYPKFEKLIQEAQIRTSKIIIVPAKRIAEQINHLKGENLIMLGVLNSYAKLFSSETFKQEITKRWPKLVEKNLIAYENGFNFNHKR